MKFFRPEKRFSRLTGEPIENKMVLVGFRCDFCGEIMEDEGIQIHIDYGNMDSCFGCEEGESQLQDFGIDLHDFLCQPYIYHNVWTNSSLSCDLSLMRQEVPKQDDPRKSYRPTIESVLRASRIRVVTKLLNDGILQVSEISPN